MNKNYLKYYIYNDLFIFLKKILFGGIYFYNIVLLTYYIKYIYILNIILCNFLNFFINKNNNNKLHKKKIKNISYVGTILKKSRIKKKKKYIYDFIICLKKKNVFLTFLDYSKNVLLKNNIGSFGFKKKLKFTGFAIENTSLNFCKKIKKILYLKLRSKLKIMWEKLTNLRNQYMSYVKETGINKFAFKKINLYFRFSKNFLKRNIYRNTIKYRRYGLFKMYIKKEFTSFFLERNFSIIILFKNNIKYWPFKYIIKGLSKVRLRYIGFKDKRPITHSLGFRLKKQRRV